MCHSRTCYPLMVITVLLMGISKFNGHLEQTFLYLEIEPLNSSSTLRNIGSIPMKNYEFKFDSTPGRRQMGFFGTEVMTAFPESVEIAPKYSLPNRDRSKSATVVIDYPLVDKSVIFMHTVAAIQGLQRCYELLSELLESCQSHELNISKEVASMLALTEIGSDWLPSHSLQILREISKPRRDLTNVLIEKTLTSNEKRLDHATYKRQLREVIHLTHHYQIGNATLESNGRIDDFCLSKMNVLGNLSHSMLISGYENEIKELDIDYDVRDKGFIRSIDQIHPLVSFRIRTQQELLDEEYDRTLMNAQDEAMRNEIGLMIDVLVTELLSFFARINIAPSALFLRGLIGVFLCLAFMLTQEILRALKRHLASKLFASSELSNQRPLKVQGSSINNLRIEDLTHGSTAMRSLRDFSDNLQNSYSGKLRVPSLLLLGRSGAGKSVSAKAVAASSGATAITVTGVEILSKGKQAGLYFRNLLDKMRKQKGHHIVIILDDADAIIKSRDSIRSNNDASSVHSCYYLLLEAMRESSLKLSFIVTTSLNGSSSVDSAFLDRMDAIIELPLPQAEQRFNFIARRSIDLFSAFLISENRTALESYLPHAHRQCGSETTSLGQDMNLSYLAGHISVASAPHNVDSSLVHEYDCYINDIHFNVADCISRLVSCSEGWSLRDVSKILTNIRSEVLGTESR